MPMTPYELKMTPDTKCKCLICGEEHTFGDFDEHGAVAIFIDKNGPRPVCVCNSDRCMGTVTLLGGQVRQRTVGKVPSFSITPSGDGKYVSLSVGDMGMNIPSGLFINMFMDMTTKLFLRLKPEPGSVKMPTLTNLPPMVKATVLDSIGDWNPPNNTDLNTCPCCNFRDLYTFEDGPGDVTVQCNVCGRYGHGRTKADAMADLASKKEVSP